MKALKAFVIWLLLAVIPMQGMTVNIAMAGNAAHRAAAQETFFAHELMHHVDHHDAAPGAEVLHDEPKQSNDACQSGHAQAPGGSCATFCPLSMWMPAGDMMLPVVENTSGRISYIAFHVPFVVPDRPEHPPRFLSV